MEGVRWLLAPKVFAATHGCVAGARWELETFLAGAVADEVVEVAVLLVSELATNAFLHARSPFTVSAALEANAVRVEVEDESAQLPAVGHPDPEAAGGRGMFLVEALACCWGSEPTPGGKRVWFELALP